jgi:hypothetical protein
MTENQQKQELKVHLPEQMQSGVYSNNMRVMHTKEEFILDYMLIIPPTGTVTARVIISPGHMKRALKALTENVRRYEEKHGVIKEAEEPQSKTTMGLIPPEKRGTSNPFQ